MTTFYACHYVYGPVRGSDDLAEVNWWNVDAVNINDLVGEHQILFNALLEYIKNDTFINRERCLAE